MDTWVSGEAPHAVSGLVTGQTYELVTDETGLFTFADLPKDRYVFTAELPDGLLYAR